jgi:hypothetical protein
MLLTTEKVRRDFKSCAERINPALPDLEETMDEWPNIRDALMGVRQRLGDEGLTAQKVGYTHFRLNSIKTGNLPVDRTRWLAGVASNSQAALDAFQ